MPTYEYRCTNCGEHLEVVQSFTDEPLGECPNCGKKALRKVFSPVGIVFKGSARDVSVAKEGAAYRVKGDRIERLATGIDWDSAEASAYFHRMLERNGVERRLWWSVRTCEEGKEKTMKDDTRALAWHRRG